MKEEISELKDMFLKEISQIKDVAILVDLEIKYLGRKAGELTQILRGLKDLPEKQRKEIGVMSKVDFYELIEMLITNNIVNRG